MRAGPQGAGTTASDGGDTGSSAATPMVGEALTIAEVLELLGYGPDELLSVLVIAPGATQPDPRTGLYRAEDLAALTGLEDVNLWHSLSTFRPGTTGRGKESDVARIPALWADLDVEIPGLKARGVPTWELAWELVADLSGILGVHPVYVTCTGHGLQPAWALDCPESTDVLVVAAALRRFGMLVRNVARLRGCTVDSVWDPPRVLRATGSTNWKNPAAPVPARAYATGGAPIALVDLVEIFEDYNVPHVMPEEEIADEPTPAASWRWSPQTCGYVAGMLKSWQDKEQPPARHPWLVSTVTRLAAAHRQGCLSETGWRAGIAELEARMRVWCKPDPAATGKERDAQEKRYARIHDEIHNPEQGAITWAITRVETKTEEGLANEYRKCRECQTRRNLREWILDAQGGEDL